MRYFDGLYGKLLLSTYMGLRLQIVRFQEISRVCITLMISSILHLIKFHRTESNVKGLMAQAMQRF